MRMIATSRRRDEEDGFSRITVLVECSAEARIAIERLADEYHPDLDVFSFRVLPPNLLELGIQFDSGTCESPTEVLRQRVRSRGG